MPAIEIDDQGTQFYYYDSGVPAIQDVPYTTIVLCHGYIYNSYTLRQLLPLAAASHIRLVLLNRRGYHGSTPLDISETTAKHPTTNPELYRVFLQKRAEELAKFLVKFIEIEEIPPKVEKPGRASGGLSLIGWSLGNIPVVGLLAFADTFDSVLTNKLETHLRKAVLYDTVYHVFGFPYPANSYNPLWDPEIPQEERATRFGTWISSYWSHSPKFMDVPAAELLNGYLEQRDPNPAKPPTVTRFTPDEVAKGVETISYKQGDNFPVLVDNRPVNLETLRKFLFEKSDKASAKKPLADVEASCILCTESYWEAFISVPLLKAEMESPPPGHYLHRSIKFPLLEGCNHYAHYDDPVKAFAAFASAIEY